MRMEIKKTNKNHDSDDITFYKGSEQLRGFGYKSKSTGIFFLELCPQCGKENYLMNMGTCAWCRFDIIDLLANRPHHE